MFRFNLSHLFKRVFPILSIAIPLYLLITSVSVFGQETVYEEPPVFIASSLLTEAMESSPSHNVRSPIGLQGMHYSFDVWSRDGWYNPESLDMLKIRLAEIQALDALARMQQDPLFVQGLNDRMIGTADATVNSVKQPFKTAENIPFGLANYEKVLDSLSSEVPMFSREQVMELHEEAKRDLAASLGVDPYTDNVPLQIALNDVAANNNRNVLRNRIDFAVIPGVGSTLEAAHFSKNLQDMLLTHSESNLQKETRKDLRNMGVPKADIDDFMQNSDYPLSWRAAIAEALLGLSGVDGIQGYIHAIQEAPRPEVALFYLRRIQLAEKYHRSVRQLSKMELVGPTPIFFDRKGAMVVTVSVDYAYWNEDLSNRIAEVRKNLSKATVDIYITGTASDLVKEKLTEQGFAVHEKWGID